MLFERISRLKKSISFKLAVFFSLSFSVCLALAFLFSYFQIAQSLEQADREILVAKWREITAILDEEPIDELKEFFSQESQQLKNARFTIRIFDKKGKNIFLKPAIQENHSGFESEILRMQKQRDYRTGWSSIASADDEDQLDLYTESFAPGRYLQVGRSSEVREDLLEKLFVGFVSISAFFVLISGFLGWVYARSAVKPVRKLTQAIQGIESGNLSKRVPLTASKNELEDLVRTFNGMADRVESLVRGMKESLDNVSHDIRTPLARMKVIAERALISGDPREVTLALEDCAENVTEIAAIVDRILEISEAEAGTMVLNREASAVRKLIAELFDLYEFVALERSVKMTLNCPLGLTWNLDRRRFKQVVGNLLDNAIKYSPQGSEITIEVSVENQLLRVSIKDEGTGVSQQDLPFIWDRLYRADKSRSSKGSGIGLALVKSIVTAQGGSVEYKAQQPRGSVFTVRVPGPLDNSEPPDSL